MKQVPISSLLVVAALSVAGTYSAATRSAGQGEGSDASAAAEGEQQPAEPASLSLVRSVDLPAPVVEGAGGVPASRGMDTYVDWDVGAITHVHESGAVSSMPMPPNWLVESVLDPASGLYAMTMQRSTGMAYVLEDAEWVPVAEPDGLPLLVGDFDLTFGIVEGAVYALRFDKFSGRSWLLQGEEWLAIGGNLEGWPEPAEDEEGR